MSVEYPRTATMPARAGVRDTDAAQSPINVSIVVPTHFRPVMLSRLLDAIKHLAYPQDRLELIVVGAEEDGSRQEVESFGQAVSFRVTYEIVPKNALGSVAFKRNAGAAAATGDIIAFIDDDCVPDPQWTAAAVPLFRDPAVGGVEGLIVVPAPDRPTLTYRGSLRLQEPGGYRTGNMFYRRAAFQDAGWFDESLPYLEDTDLGFTVIERGYTIPFAPGAIVSHPVQPGRPLTRLRLARTARDLPYLFAKHARSRAALRHNLRLFNRADYPYLALYGLSTTLTALNPVTGAMLLAIGVCVLVPLHIAHDFWGLHFTAREVTLEALTHPIVPVARLVWWLVGATELSFGLRRKDKRASR